MSTNRPYTGTKDGAAKGKRPGTEKLVDLCRKRWGFTNLGTWVVRDMRGKPGNLSVHATARAADIGYGTGKEARKKGVEAFNWLLQNAAALGIEEIHDYAFGKFGRGYRCSRASKDGGVIVYKDLASSAGSVGGTWLHVELSPAMADNAEAFEAAWRALPKPPKPPKPAA
jgi:hypothetical protein